MKIISSKKKKCVFINASLDVKNIFIFHVSKNKQHFSELYVTRERLFLIFVYTYFIFS